MSFKDILLLLIDNKIENAITELVQCGLKNKIDMTTYDENNKCKYASIILENISTGEIISSHITKEQAIEYKKIIDNL